MKNIFNKKLFSEALRQLKIPASLFLGILFGISGIMVFVGISDATENYNYTHAAMSLDLNMVLIYLALIYALIIPVFTFKLFKFLTRRNASDFYHAIPQTRTCIMFTYTVAILLVSTVFLIISVAIPVIAYSLADKYIYFNTAGALKYALNTFVCMILCLGVCLLSSSMTGTFFTNIIFALGIIFGPRAVISITTDALASSLNNILPYNASFGLFSNDTNLIWDQICSIFMYGETSSSTSILGFSTIYTLVLGIIYISVAFVLFNKRKSEQAESSSRNPFAQHSIRIGIGFVFCLLSTHTLFINGASEKDSMFWIEFLTYIFVAFCGMTVFEMLTTKKVKNMLNVLASFPAIIVLCVIVYFTLNIAQNNMINYSPNASEVDYIQYSKSYYYFEEDYDYNNYKISNIKFTDEKLLTFVTEKLSEQMDAYKKYVTSENYDKISFSSVYGKTNEITIKFKDGFSSAERTIYLDENEYVEFQELLTNNTAYIEALRTLPDDYEITWGDEYFSTEEIHKIVSALKSDLKEIPFETIPSVIGLNENNTNNFMNLYLSTMTDTGELYFDLYISSETPKALQTALDILADRAETEKKNVKNISDLFMKMDSLYEGNNFCNISFTVYELETYKQIGLAGFSESTKADFDYDDSSRKEKYESYDKLLASVEEFMSNYADADSAKYIVFADCIMTEGYDTYKEYHTFFFTNDKDNIDYITKEPLVDSEIYYEAY